MKISVLGCSGGIGAGLRTTSLLVDDDILIDAGTGVGDLPLDQLARLRHIFVTHSHLDHIAAIPLLVDTVFDLLEEPLTIHGREETLAALRDHIFNNVVWPDFSCLPHRDQPALRYETMAPGERRRVGEREVQMVPVNHAVPGASYLVAAESGGTFAFSGDTSTTEPFWEELNARTRLDLLIVEAAFAEQDRDLARDALHYSPGTLAADLGKLEHRPDVWISHLKPGAEDQIFGECCERVSHLALNQLRGGEVFTL